MFSLEALACSQKEAEAWHRWRSSWSFSGEMGTEEAEIALVSVWPSCLLNIWWYSVETTTFQTEIFKETKVVFYLTHLFWNIGIACFEERLSATHTLLSSTQVREEWIGFSLFFVLILQAFNSVVDGVSVDIYYMDVFHLNAACSYRFLWLTVLQNDCFFFSWLYLAHWGV